MNETDEGRSLETNSEWVRELFKNVAEAERGRIEAMVRRAVETTVTQTIFSAMTGAQQDAQIRDIVTRAARRAGIGNDTRKIAEALESGKILEPLIVFASKDTRQSPEV